MWFEVYSGKLCYIWTIMMAVKDPISSFIPYSHNNETHSNCQRVSVTSVTTVTAVISTHVQKITITWVLILRTVPCNQDTSQKHTPSNHSLSGLPFTFLNQAWPYCYLPVCFLTIVVPVISTVPAVPRDPCLPTEGLFPQLRHPAPLRLCSIHPISPSASLPCVTSINTLVWPIPSVSHSLSRDTNQGLSILPNGITITAKNDLIHFKANS